MFVLLTTQIYTTVVQYLIPIDKMELISRSHLEFGNPNPNPAIDELEEYLKSVEPFSRGIHSLPPGVYTTVLLNLEW